MKINARQTTLKTLIALKQDIYARAARRAQDLHQAGGDLKSLAAKLQAIHSRADHDASRVAFTINLLRTRA